MGSNINFAMVLCLYIRPLGIRFAPKGWPKCEVKPLPPPFGILRIYTPGWQFTPKVPKSKTPPTRRPKRPRPPTIDFWHAELGLPQSLLRFFQESLSWMAMCLYCIYVSITHTHLTHNRYYCIDRIIGRHAGQILILVNVPLGDTG